MSWQPEIDELRRRQALARAMGGPEKLKRHRDNGKLNVRERIDALLDQGSFHEIGEPVNDGERDVLRILRDGLAAAWHVISNFSIEQAGRAFECDALAVSPDGWAYLIEVKAWLGGIRGNDAELWRHADRRFLIVD